MAESVQPQPSGFRPVGGAWVHETARLGSGVVLEPGVVIGASVEAGRACRFGAGAVVYGPTVLGAENVIHAGVVLGGDPQDIGFKGGLSRLEIGDRNTFREGVTVSRGSPKGDGTTRIGNDNYFMALSHVGHDVRVEDRCILANDVLIGGHCHLAQGANVAGASALTQFVSLGRLAYVGGGIGVRQDLEPFIYHDTGNTGVVARPMSVNVIGLRRGGVSESSIDKLRAAYRLLFRQRGRPFDESRAEIQRLGLDCPEMGELLEFVARKRTARFGRQLDARQVRSDKDE